MTGKELDELEKLIAELRNAWDGKAVYHVSLLEAVHKTATPQLLTSLIAAARERDALRREVTENIREHLEAFNIAAEICEGIRREMKVAQIKGFDEDGRYLFGESAAQMCVDKIRHHASDIKAIYGCEK